jgi:hypothetical protein
MTRASLQHTSTASATGEGEGRVHDAEPIAPFPYSLPTLDAANGALAFLRPPSAAAKDAQAGGCQAAASIKAERPFPN